MRVIMMVLTFEMVLAAVLFGTAGRFDLPWYWGLIGVHTVLLSVAWGTMDAELRRERLKPGGGCIDRGFRMALSAMLLLHLVTAGLDVRFGWSPNVPLPAKALAMVVYIAGVVFSLRAMAANRFFSSVVRVQTERGHVTVSHGPYQLVRHPGYLGMLAAVFGECFVLGSLWAILPALLFAAVVFRRTAIEDGFLREKLLGYVEYARRVRWRLVPGVW